MNDIVQRLRTPWGGERICPDDPESVSYLIADAIDHIEAQAAEIARLKAERDEYLQFWKNNAEAYEAAEAEVVRMLEGALKKIEPA